VGLDRVAKIVGEPHRGTYDNVVIMRFIWSRVRGMTSKFETEKAKVTLLMQRLGRTFEAYEDPNTGRGAAGESGADVIAIDAGRRIGVQVTDLDTGSRPGKARAEESKLARNAQAQATTYSTWGQNDPAKLVDAFARSVTRKARMSFSGFDEFWLLICAGVPTSGAIGSTFAMTPWIETSALDTATLPDLERSKYTRAFLRSILGVENQVVFEWRRGERWSKSALSLPPEQQDPSFWEQIKDPELLSDPGGWFERQVQRAVEDAKKKAAP
jgi:hypothetical protein